MQVCLLYIPVSGELVLQMRKNSRVADRSQLLDLQCWTDWAGTVLPCYCPLRKSPGSWHSLICLSNGTAKCSVNVCIDLKGQLSPCDAKESLPLQSVLGDVVGLAKGAMVNTDI